MFSTHLADAVNALDDKRKQLLKKQLKAWLDRKNTVTAIEKIHKNQGVALTAAQQRLYDLCATSDGYQANLVCQKVVLKGELQPSVFEKSLLLVTERHPVFKTVFRQDANGVTLQYLNEQLTHNLEVVDLTGQADKSTGQWEQSHREERYDLEQGPLFRFTLIQTAPQTFIFLFTTHNLVFDAWSYSVFVKELKHFYNAALQKANGALPRNQVDFLDYAAWTRQWPQDKRYQNQLDYWLNTIKTPHGDDLTLDHSRESVSAQRGYKGARIEFELGEALREKLTALANRNGATLFMVLLAAINAFFALNMDMKNICIGTISANRVRREIENVLGYFINLTPINANVTPAADSLRHILEQIKQRVLQTMENGDVYTEELAGAGEYRFDKRRNPFFDILFSFENFQGDETAFTGLSESYQDIDKGTARYDLTFSIYDEPQRFYGWLEYNTGLFTTQTANKIADSFAAFLPAISAHPDLTLNRIAK